MENEEDYNDKLDLLFVSNWRLRIIKNAILILNIISLIILVDNIKAKVMLIIAYLFYAIVAHIVNEGSGIVHTVEALGEVCFNYEEDSIQE